MRRGVHLPPAALGDHILGVFGVRLHLDAVGAAGAAHAEPPDAGGVVHADLLLLGIEAHPLANEVLAALTPAIEGHLKADDQDALVQLLGPLPQGVLPSELRAGRD